MPSHIQDSGRRGEKDLRCVEMELNLSPPCKDVLRLQAFGFGCVTHRLTCYYAWERQRKWFSNFKKRFESG